MKNSKLNKTTTNQNIKIDRHWHLIDLSTAHFGRLCTQIAALLMGKGKTTFSYHIDNGDYVVAINASLIRLTGKKVKQNYYYHHTGYAGNLKEYPLSLLLAKKPEMVVRNAVAGMLPKNRLRSGRLGRLKVFIGPDHPYQDKLK